jgi:hypothetical protein
MVLPIHIKSHAYYTNEVGLDYVSSLEFQFIFEIFV